MIVYRLTKSKHQNDLSGKGAELAGGRWNSKGIPVIYTCSSRALCTAEIAAHTSFGTLPRNYVLVSIELPETTELYEVYRQNLSEDWASFPHPLATKQVGDKLLNDCEYLVLKVPSAVVQGDFNYLINPRHKDMKMVKIVDTERFEFDQRLFQ